MESDVILIFEVIGEYWGKMTKQNEVTPKLASRRQLLKALGVVGGTVAGAAALPDRWTKPITESVYLPAHARTSFSLRIGGLIGGGLVNNDTNGGFLDFIISEAHANTDLTGGCMSVDIPGSNTGTFIIHLLDSSTIEGNAQSDGQILTGSGGGVSIFGTHTTATHVVGTASNGSSSFGFELDENGYVLCDSGPGPTPTPGPTNTPSPTSTPVPTSTPEPPPPPPPTATPMPTYTPAPPTATPTPAPPTPTPTATPK